MKKKRIFWLGMHKVLIQTELPTLREMGYEVFNPPYLSDIKDQSAQMNWSSSETTLPEKIYKKLATYNFFYNYIDSSISKILNDYFDAIIVTINPDWLVSVLKVFKKTIIYRTYGGVGLLSDSLLSNGGYKLISECNDFWFLPHCAETVSDEHNWLKARMKIAPYWLTEDVFLLHGQWQNKWPKKACIGLSCPNVSNPYYKQHFIYLKTYFEQRCFRYYGVQIEDNADPNIVGTLPRDRYLEEFLFLSGYLYTYRERNVCYLPPIEMMVLGGPVLYFYGSLLHRYFGSSSPGLVKNEEDALKKSKLLIKGDSGFVKEILASQEVVARRYSRNYGFPIFSKILSAILEKPDISKHNPVSVLPKQAICSKPKPVLLFAHFAGAYIFSNGEYSTIHGIPRVMRQLVKALTSLNIPVAVTAFRNDLVNTHGFYSSHCTNPELVTVIPIDDLKLGIVSPASGAITRGTNWYMDWVLQKFPVLKNIRDKNRHNPTSLNTFERNSIRVCKALLRRLNRAEAKLLFFVTSGIGKLRRASMPKIKHGFNKIGYSHDFVSINTENNLEKWRYVIVPHYYLFPEVLAGNFNKILAYIPDYIPHFFKGRDFFPHNELHVKLGRKLAKSAMFVLTNSKFSADYLPNCSLAVPKDKIIFFPMPFLGMSSDNADESIARHQEVALLSRKKFIFYPTQPHPNKRLDLLVRSWIAADKLSPDIHLELVITSGYLHPALWDLIKKENLESRVHQFPGISDNTLAWLYKNAVCLALTSELEGNLPTQLLEALYYHCPVVAMENLLITSELGKISEELTLVPFADCDLFAKQIIYAAENRAEVLKRQKNVLDYIDKTNSFTIFAKNVKDLDARLQ